MAAGAVAFQPNPFVEIFKVRQVLCPRFPAFGAFEGGLVLIVDKNFFCHLYLRDLSDSLTVQN